MSLVVLWFLFVHHSGDVSHASSLFKNILECDILSSRTAEVLICDFQSTSLFLVQAPLLFLFLFFCYGAVCMSYE